MKRKRDNSVRTGDYRIEDDGERRARRRRRRDMLGEVVVVLDGLETDRLAVETEVVHRHGRREEGLDC